MRLGFLLAVVVTAGVVSAQQTNGAFSSLTVTPGTVPDPASTLTVLNQGPLSINTFTDSPLTINVRGNPNSPVVVFQGPLLIGAVNIDFYGTSFQVDIAQTGTSYDNQILANGFTLNPTAVTDNLGNYSLTVVVPACTTQANGQTNCTTVNTFSLSTQALTVDPTVGLGAPAGLVGVRTTAATTATFTNGYKEYNLGDSANQQVVFLDGFSFPFYNHTYTSTNSSPTTDNCYIYADGFIKFGASGGAGFPNPVLNDARTGARKIFNWFSDLVPGPFGDTIYSQQFVDTDGTRKIKLVHYRRSEFANATGPHGGESIIDENGNISINVHNYQVAPSINVLIGVAPGGQAPAGQNVGPNSTTYGRDLSVDMTTPGGFQLTNVWNEAVEFFDTGNGTPCQNCVDLIGLGAGTGGMKFLVTPGMGFLLTL